MSLPIPLLDRPSAVGDEGRPRETSLAVVSVAVAVLVGVAGYRIGQLDLVVTLSTVAGPVAAGMALLDRERFVHRFFGHGLVSWFGWPLSLLVFAGPLYSRTGLAVAGFAVALFGLTATWSDAADRDALRRATNAAGATYVATWLWLAVVLVCGLLAAALLGGLAFAVGTGGPVAASFGVGVVVAASGGAVVVGLRWLPFGPLAPPAKRAAVVARVGTVRRAAVLAATAGIAVAVLVVALWLGSATAVSPIRTVLVGVGSLASWTVLGPVAAVGAAVFVAGLCSRSVRSLAARTASPSSGRLAAVLAALPMALAMLVVIALAFRIPFVGPLLAVGAVLSPMVLVFLLAVAFTAAERRLVPDRAGGPAVAALGLLVAAVGIVPVSAPLSFACVAAAVLTWDVSTYGLGVTAELGQRPDTRRVELVHGVVSVGVAAVATLLVVGLDLLRSGIAGDVGGPLPALVAGLGAVLVASSLRG